MPQPPKLICNSIGSTHECHFCGASRPHSHSCCEPCPINPKARCILAEDHKFSPEQKAAAVELLDSLVNLATALNKVTATVTSFSGQEVKLPKPELKNPLQIDANYLLNSVVSGTSLHDYFINHLGVNKVYYDPVSHRWIGQLLSE